MAQGIKKGFFFYFGLFALLLIAVFMVCLVVMMFNPGKTVLWMQYFTANETIFVDKTTDESQTTINLSDLSNVEINCSYAEVDVVRSKELTKDGIYIINNAKGFTGAKDAVHFNYSVEFEGAKLKISITEPNGFLFLSKDIKVVLNTFIERNANFDDTDLTIVTTKGDVNIGDTWTASEEIRLSKLTVETNSGSINLKSNFDTSGLIKLDLHTKQGKIEALDTVEYGTKTAYGIKLPDCGEIKLKNDQGRINIGALIASGKELEITCTKGDVAIDYIDANLIRVACAQGNYKFGTITGNLTYEDSETSLLAPNILVDYILGDFSISALRGAQAKPNITIGKIDGMIDALVDRGTINVGEANGAISITSDGELGVNVVVGEGRTSSENIYINNVSGAIKLGFLKNVLGDVELQSKNGNITLNFVQTAKFVSTAYINDGTKETLIDPASGKIHVNIGTTGDISINPLKPNETESGASGSVTVITNKNVYYNTKTVDEIKVQNEAV